MSMCNLKWWGVDLAREARVRPSVRVTVLGVGNHGCTWRGFGCGPKPILATMSHVAFWPNLSLSVWNSSELEINIEIKVSRCVSEKPHLHGQYHIRSCYLSHPNIIQPCGSILWSWNMSIILYGPSDKVKIFIYYSDIYVDTRNFGWSYTLNNIHMIHYSSW